MTCNVKVKFRAQSVPPPHRLYFPTQAQTTIKTFGWHKQNIEKLRQTNYNANVKYGLRYRAGH